MIHAHMDFETTITMELPSSIPIYHFLVSIPHYIAVVPENGEMCPEHPEQLDLSFIRNKALRSKNQAPLQIFRNRFSLLVCGSGYDRYNAYTFVDTHPGMETLEDKDEDMEFSYPDSTVSPIHEEPILRPHIADANTPFYDVRIYTLRDLRARIGYIRKSWKEVIGELEPLFQHYVRERFSPRCPSYRVSYNQIGSEHSSDISSRYQGRQYWRG
jgi:hypothetical protein